jgi:arsenate reductase
MKELQIDDTWEIQDIREQNIDEATVEALKKEFGSYEAFFSKRALKYKSMGLKDKHLRDADYKKLILEEYTFLKRPVLILNGKYFVGNAPKTIAAAKEWLRTMG